MYRMITRDSDGKIIDIQESNKAYFWNKNGQMTLGVSRWINNWILQGYTIIFEIC
jgi:hypothetical protein